LTQRESLRPHHRTASPERNSLLCSIARAAGVFMTAMLGDLQTGGLVNTPPGAAIGLAACAAVIVPPLRPDKRSQP
jgi:hypothetical protein